MTFIACEINAATHPHVRGCCCDLVAGWIEGEKEKKKTTLLSLMGRIRERELL